MNSGFEEFAEAMAGHAGSAVTPAMPRYERVTVLGGGHDAQLLAALCLAEGASVTLFSAYGAELDALRKGHGIAIRGAGPVGDYQVDRTDAPSIATTAELDRAVSDAEVIFLTGPVHKQRTYAMVLADHVREGQILVLAPGRSFGAAEAAWLLRIGGATVDFTLVEVQGLPFWYSVTGNQFSLSPAASTMAATLPAGRDTVLEGLKPFLSNLDPTINTVRGSFADGSGLVEVPTLLIGGPATVGGLPPIPLEAQPLPENDTFRALIGPQHKAVMARMADERQRVARQFGIRDLPNLDRWLDCHAGALKGEGYRAVPDFKEAQIILRDATIGSLVPLLSAAQIAEEKVPVTESMVSLAGSILGAQMQNAGRRLDLIGIEADSVDDARRVLDAIAGGRR